MYLLVNSSEDANHNLPAYLFGRRWVLDSSSHLSILSTSLNVQLEGTGKGDSGLLDANTGPRCPAVVGFAVVRAGACVALVS